MTRTAVVHNGNDLLVPVPMTGFEMPTLVSAPAAMGNPMVTSALAYPIALDPHVAAAIPTQYPGPQ